MRKFFQSEKFIILLFFLIPLLGYWRNFDLFGTNLRFFDGDFIGYYYPDFEQGVRAFQNILHLKFSHVTWDPYNLLGFPLIGAVDRVGIFYPVRILFYAISSLFPEKYHVFFAMYYSVFHLSLAGIFTYLFARTCLGLRQFSAFIVGLIYCITGAFIYISIYTNVVPGPAFLPLELYFLFQAMKRSSWPHAIAAGFAFTPIFLSGYTSTFLYNNIFAFLLVCLFLVRSPRSFLQAIGFFAVADAVALGVSAAVFLPSVEVQHLATRQVLDLVGSSSASYRVESLIQFLIPFFYGAKTSTVMGYLGLLPLFLVVYTVLRVRTFYVYVFTGLAYLFTMLSIADGTFFHEVFYKLVPFYGFFRFHLFEQYLVAFCLAAVAGYGLQHIEKQNLWEDVSGFFGKLVLTVFCLFFMVHLLAPLLQGGPGASLLRDVTVGVSIALLFSVGTYLTLTLTRGSVMIRNSAIVLLIALDLFTLIVQNQFLNTAVDPRDFTSKSELITKMSSRLETNFGRTYLYDSTLRFNSALANLHQVDGFYSIPPDNYNVLLNHFTKKGSLGPAIGSPVLDMLGVRYVVSSDPVGTAEAKIFTLVEHARVPPEDKYRYLSRSGVRTPVGGSVYLYENTAALPRAFLVSNVERSVENEEALARLDAVDIHTTAVVHTADQLPAFDTEKKPGDTLITSYDPSQVDIDVSANGKSLLVLSDSYFPGWHAYVDGKEQPILRTNVYLRGVVVDEGKHMVRFSYKPTMLYTGLVISLLSLVLSVGYLYRGRHFRSLISA